jgi:hypothetical protein
MLGDDASDNEKEDDDDEEEDMEDVPPAAVKLEDVVPDNYDEDAATTATMVTWTPSSQCWRTSSSSRPWR